MSAPGSSAAGHPPHGAGHRPQLAEAWARAQGLLEQSLGRRECSAWSVSVRQHLAPKGTLALGHARAFRAEGALPGPLHAVAEPEPLTPGHVFDWASLTKVVGGQLLLMQEVAAGRLHIDQRVSTLLPAFSAASHADITLAQLLSYTTGMPAWRPLYALAKPAGDLMSLIVQQGLQAAPGTQRLYSDLGHIALGAALAAHTGTALDQLFDARVANVLGLTRVGYVPGRTLRAPAVATSFGNVYEQRMLTELDFGMPAEKKGSPQEGYRYEKFRAGLVVGEVDDGNAHYVLGGISAHAGLFGTAEELAAIAEAMVLGGPHDAALGLNNSVRQAFITADAQGHLPSWWHAAELGLPIPAAAPHQVAEGVMMRGFSGTCVYVEPARQLVVAMLSNREHVDGFGHYVNLRPVFHDVVHVFRSL